MNDEAPPDGCESTNHDRASCYGDLWQCEQCERVVCWAEGMADSDPELCDDCWAKKHEED